ncbi:hypothetical protein IH980_02850 [Patescibacteria group bacterium]|nr:hypothetical protein [Patescibacteria group bacterium]
MEIKHIITLRWSLAVLILVVIVVPSFLSPDSGFQKARISVLSHPNSYSIHLELAELAAHASDWEVARREFTHAVALVERPVIGNLAGLGKRFADVRVKVFAERYLREEIARWEYALLRQPGNRDAYLMLAILHYQFSDDSETQANWQKAWEIDPNNEQIHALGRFLGVDQ